MNISRISRLALALAFGVTLSACSSTPPDQQPSEQVAPGTASVQSCQRLKRRTSPVRTISRRWIPMQPRGRLLLLTCRNSQTSLSARPGRRALHTPLFRQPLMPQSPNTAHLVSTLPSCRVNTKEPFMFRRHRKHYTLRPGRKSGRRKDWPGD